VELTGEAYFEVAPDQGKAFIVHISSGHPAEKPTSIEVLGTSFDVMAYPDEPAMTTSLVNGSVKVIRGTSSVLLKPGEQASIKTGDPEAIHVVTDADMTGALAWKNGLFRFNGNDIQSVMRQISRWYDVDVRYEGDVSAHFLGTISRKADVTEVFRILKLTEAVDFKIEGKTIIVIPKNQ
jgi:ferric-dicitrate binding protein FerR (iron transport regulator)